MRTLSKDKGFTVVALATLALGLGATTAVLSIVDTVIFRPLPYTEPSRLLKICGAAPGQVCGDDISLPELDDLRSQNHSFSELAADDGKSALLTSEDGSRDPVAVALVSGNWLSTLGIRPALGRGFLPTEMASGGDRVVLLTQEYWQRHFASSPQAIGRRLTLDGVPFTVVGVLPPNVLRGNADLLEPLVAAEYSADRRHRDLDVFGRLAPRATLEQAREDVAAIANRWSKDYPEVESGHPLGAEPLGSYYAGIGERASQGLILILGAVGLILGVACVNIAGLLLARGAARRRECLVRSALGATRGRLVRQLLAETALLFLVGGALGGALAHAAVRALTNFAIEGGYVPAHMTVAVDARALASGLLISLIAGLLSGLIPAFQASRVDLNEGLRDAGRGVTRGVRGARTRHWMLASELALSLVLLIAFGLLVRSFLRVRIMATDLAPETLLETRSESDGTFARALQRWQLDLDTARALPGVQFAAMTSRPPVHAVRRQGFEIAGRPAAAAGEAEAEAGDVFVSPDYFRALGIPLIQGRGFDGRDAAGSVQVAILSQSLARRYFPLQNPIGQHLRLAEHSPMGCCLAPGAVEGVWREVVGVVADTREANLDEALRGTIYRPFSQIVEVDMYLVARAESPAVARRLAVELRPRLESLDGASWSPVESLGQVIHASESMRRRRFILVLLGSFAAAALLLAAVGIYGVTALRVTERTGEIGVRLVLGATRGGIVRSVLAEIATTALAGLALGSAIALASTGLLQSMLFGIEPIDVATYAGVWLSLGTVVLLAALVPALRAVRLEAAVALRHD